MGLFPKLKERSDYSLSLLHLVELRKKRENSLGEILVNYFSNIISEENLNILCYFCIIIHHYKFRNHSDLSWVHLAHYVLSYLFYYIFYKHTRILKKRKRKKGKEIQPHTQGKGTSLQETCIKQHLEQSWARGRLVRFLLGVKGTLQQLVVSITTNILFSMSVWTSRIPCLYLLKKDFSSYFI